LGQSIVKLPNGNYASNGKELSKYEIADYLYKNETSWNYYLQYIKKKKRGYKQLRTGIILSSLGLLSTYIGYRGGIGDNKLGGFQFFLTGGLVTTAVGAGYIIVSTSSKKHILDKAVTIYNHQIPSMGMSKSIHFGVTPHGLGLVHNF